MRRARSWLKRNEWVILAFLFVLVNVMLYVIFMLFNRGFR